MEYFLSSSDDSILSFSILFGILLYTSLILKDKYKDWKRDREIYKLIHMEVNKIKR